MVNTKIKTLKPPRHVKHVLLVFIPSVPPPCARIAKKASFKNWRKLSNTIVNFVPKQQHLIRPVARVLHVRVVNIKNKIPQLRSHASIVPLEPNGQQLQMCVMLVTMENTKIKTLLIQFLVNFVSLEQLLKPKLNPAPLVLMGNIKIKTPRPLRLVKRVRLVFIPLVPPPCARIAK